MFVHSVLRRGLTDKCQSDPRRVNNGPLSVRPVHVGPTTDSGTLLTGIIQGAVQLPRQTILRRAELYQSVVSTEWRRAMN